MRALALAIALLAPSLAGAQQALPANCWDPVLLARGLASSGFRLSHWGLSGADMLELYVSDDRFVIVRPTPQRCVTLEDRITQPLGRLSEAPGNPRMPGPTLIPGSPA